MPHIRIRGAEKEDVKGISKELIDNLETIIGCPRDYFVLEVVNSTFIWDGNEAKGYPFVEVAWFKRNQEIQDKVAEEITRAIKTFSSATVDVAFTEYTEEAYYENGKHF